MALFSISEKFSLLLLALTYYIRSLRQKFTKIHVLKWRKSNNFPKSISFPPSDFHICDPTIAEDIYDGHISLAGTSYNIGANSPFSVTPPSQEWFNELISFEWLRHFEALNSQITILQARALFNDWHQSEQYYNHNVWQLGITAKRLIALLSHSTILLDNCSEVFEKSFFKIIDQHVQILLRNIKHAKHSRSRLDAAIALCFAQSCLDDGYNITKNSKDIETLLERHLNQQILADGGHISRNPDILLDIMLELIPLKLTFKEQQKAVPIALQNAIDRIIPMLHFFCHPDGNFIQFNGAGPTDWAAFLSIFDAEGDGLNAPNQAPHSGYYRLYGPDIQITMDAGETPEAQYSTTAHAGPLALEVSVKNQRVIVNCGASPKYDFKWFNITRSTPAHSTLSIDNTSTATLDLPNWISNIIGHQLFNGHKKMPVKIGKTDRGPQIIASHDGYVRNFGLLHRRVVTLSDDGELITGVDYLSPVKGKAKKTKTRNSKAAHEFDIRFHLHPNIITQPTRDGHSILLTMPDQEMWQFVSTFATFKLEDSVYMGENHRKTKTKQIVITGNVEEYAEAKWQFRKL